MALTSLDNGESRLELAISYILIIGVVIALFLETIGIAFFYRSRGHLNILSKNESIVIHGQNFFSFLNKILKGVYTQDSAILFMILGIAILILTPYIRVITSVLYFTWKKDLKYTLITIFVLIVLTLSLFLH